MYETSEPRSPKIFRVLWLLPIIVLIVFLTQTTRKFQKATVYDDLITKSRLIADSSNWERDYPGYFWRPQGDILFATGIGKPPKSWSLYDPQTKVISPLYGFTSMIQASPPRFEGLRLAKDGNSVLGHVVNQREPASYTIFPLNGSKSTSYAAAKGETMSLFWLPDGKGFAALTAFGSKPWMHIQKLGASTATTLPFPAFTRFSLGFDPEGNMIDARRDRTNLQMVRTKVEAKQAVETKSNIQLTNNSAINEIEPSPDGKRITYITETDEQAQLYGLLASLFPKYGKEHHRTQLWVGNMDGTDQRLLGTLDDIHIAALQWTPDGSAITFFAKKGLRSIKVDTPNSWMREARP